MEIGCWTISIGSLVGMMLLCCQGCTVADGYVGADRLTYKAVAPVYLRYSEADPDLDPEDLKDRQALVRSWAARIKEGGGE